MLTGQLPKLPNDFFGEMAGLSSLIILTPATQWDMMMASLPQDYQSRVVTIDSSNVKQTHRVVLAVLLQAFHLSPLGRAAIMDDNARDIRTRYGMTHVFWEQIYHYLEDDYQLYAQAKAALNACPLPTSNSASDFAAY
jgi:hypothetical protein